MTGEFISAYCENLKKQGFAVIPRDERHAEVQSLEGQAANIGVVIDADAFGDELTAFIEGCSADIAARLENTRLKTVYVVYILLTEGGRPDVARLLAEAEAYDGQRIYTVYWAVTLSDTCAVDHSKRQPGEVGGMARGLAAAFRGEAPAEPLKPVTRHLYLTYIAIAICGAVFALMGLVLPSSDPYRMITAGAVVPELVLGRGQYWRLIAAMFLHFDVLHLAANCLGIYLFGSIVERYLGPGRFLVVYFVSGIFASACCLFRPVVAAGASGAVYGLIGVSAILALRSPNRLGLSFYNMLVFIIAGIGISLVIPGISLAAHAGGLVAGLALGWLFSRR